jgi:hypothetical protein
MKNSLFCFHFGYFFQKKGKKKLEINFNQSDGRKMLVAFKAMTFVSASSQGPDIAIRPFVHRSGTHMTRLFLHVTFRVQLCSMVVMRQHEQQFKSAIT